MKFSHKIVAVSSIILLLTLSLFGIQHYLMIKNELTNVIDNVVSEISNSVKQTIDGELEGKKSLAQSVSENLELDLSHSAIQEVIETRAIKSNFITSGVGFQADGVTLENDDYWTPDDSFDPRTRPWYKDAKQKGELILSAPFVDASTGDVIISIGVPLRKSDQFIGVSFFDVGLQPLAELVNSVNLLNSGYLFIIDSQGTTIAHPNAEMNGRSFVEYVPGAVINNQTQDIVIEGKEHQVRFIKIDNEDWYIGINLDTSVAYSTVSELRNYTILFTLVALLVSIALLLMFIHRLMKPLSRLNVAIQDVATGNGDLTQRLNTDTDEEFSKLALNFNTFTESLQGQIIQSKEIGDKILRGTEHGAQIAEETSKAMNAQLRELEQLATAMNEMASTSSEVAGNAQSAASVAQQADSTTSLGQNIVSHTTEAISTLSDRIDQAVKEVGSLTEATANIETILEVINDIADQTNLLALNAAIEAARAGDSGRGFAVVADEVRTLAQRTQQSTTEIRNMIEKLQTSANSVSTTMNSSKETVADTVSKAGEANQALMDIGESIQNINDMTNAIASAAEQQSLVAEEINTNTLKIKGLSVEVSNATEQFNDALKQQSQDVQDQQSIMNKFTV